MRVLLLQLTRLLQSEEFLGAFRKNACYAVLLRVLGDDKLQSELYLQSAVEQEAPGAGLEFDSGGDVRLVEGGNGVADARSFNEDELIREQLDARVPEQLESGSGFNQLHSELVSSVQYNSLTVKYCIVLVL